MRYNASRDGNSCRERSDIVDYVVGPISGGLDPVLFALPMTIVFVVRLTGDFILFWNLFWLLWRYPASVRWTFLTGSAWCRRARRPASACPASAGSSAWSGARWARTARWWSSSGPGRIAASWARRQARPAARSCPASRRTRSRAPAFRTLEQKYVA